MKKLSGILMLTPIQYSLFVSLPQRYPDLNQYWLFAIVMVAGVLFLTGHRNSK